MDPTIVEQADEAQEPKVVPVHYDDGLTIEVTENADHFDATDGTNTHGLQKHDTVNIDRVRLLHAILTVMLHKDNDDDE